MSMTQRYIKFMRDWKASGEPVAEISCPHCGQSHETTGIPETDSMVICPHVDCQEMFYKTVDAQGHAHPSLSGKIIDALVKKIARDLLGFTPARRQA